MKSEFKFALLAAVACVGLVGCGGGGSDEATLDASAQGVLPGDESLDSTVMSEEVEGEGEGGELRQIAAASTTTWTKVANEWSSFTLTKTTTVRFGTGTKWVTKSLVAGKRYCGVSTFGSDPAPGPAKICQVASTTTTTPTTPAPTTGKATVAWVAPTKNSDGSSLSDLAGFRVYYGTAKGSYSKSITIASPYTTNYTISNLPASTYYIIVKAYDTSNNESAASTETTKTIK